MARRSSSVSMLDIVLSGDLRSEVFEEAISSIEEHRGKATNFRFNLNQVGFFPLDLMVSFLFLMNELVREGHEVQMLWNQDGSFGYAERMGFFQFLDKSVEVVPGRPAKRSNLYKRYRDNNHSLLEMSKIPSGNRAPAKGVLERLAERIHTNLGGSSEAASDVWTFASESIDNIYEHSRTPVPGIVAAQRYRSSTRGERVELVIADGGLGIPATLRGGSRGGTLKQLTDKELIFQAFTEGLSRRSDPGAGCGLKQCAAIAMKYGGNVRVRMGRVSAMLISRSAKTGMTVGFFSENNVGIKGTQIILELYLDRVAASR